MEVKPRATTEELIEALYNVPENGKAEIVNGEVVRMSPTGVKPGRGAGKIFASLLMYEEQLDNGYAFGDNVGFLVNLPNRKSFSPDAAWCEKGLVDVDDMKFFEGAPAFAVEVRSENDYTPRAERAIK